MRQIYRLEDADFNMVLSPQCLRSHSSFSKPFLPLRTCTRQDHFNHSFCARYMHEVTSQSIAILWWRQDLRLKDQAPLVHACHAKYKYLLPVYCLAPELLQPRSDHPELGGIPRLGSHRCRFLLEALHNLQKQLRLRSSDLHFAVRRPEHEIPSLMQTLAGAATCIDIYYHNGIGSQSVREEAAVKSACRAAAERLGMDCRVQAFWGHALFSPEDVLKAVAKKGHGWGACATTSSQGKHEDLPDGASDYCFADVPSVMTEFRKAMERHAVVHEPLPVPSELPPFPPGTFSSCDIPTNAAELYDTVRAGSSLTALERLTGCTILASAERDPRSVHPFMGGETAGLSRLLYFLTGSADSSSSSNSSGDNAGGSAMGVASPEEQQGLHSMEVTDVAVDLPSGQASCRHGSLQPLDSLSEPAAPIHNFKDMRMLPFGIDNSAKLSAYLALGCLSPRTVYWEAMAARERHGADTGHSCLIMHLIIRDFFLYTALKEGSRLERPEGLSAHKREWQHDQEGFERWCKGQTGFPFVDACMRELAATGYMSNRGRQNVANFLSKGMSHSWQLGAALFEALLVDHDWAINMGNWAYNAGVGNDPRDRIFRTVSQGMMYDPQAELIQAWVPELHQLSDADAHQPWALVGSDAAADVVNTTYAPPLLDVSTQVAVNYGKGL